VGPTGNVLMIDANQVWDIQQAIEYVRRLGEIRPWFIEEPTAFISFRRFRSILSSYGHCTTSLTRSQQCPRSCLCRARIQPCGIGVATGEHAHNRVVFEQLLQADAIDVIQIDSCRLAGVSEVFVFRLTAAQFVPARRWCGTVQVCHSPEVSVTVKKESGGRLIKG